MVESQLVVRGIENPRVLQAFRDVPREEFVPSELRDVAYVDSPLSIGDGQTISQPYTVAFMTELLGPQPEDRVLEVGTGSGYQAAILAELVSRVYSIERVESLARGAEDILRKLGYDNVQIRVGDGSKGWPGKAPFDGVIVTAASAEVPMPLLDQLAVGGVLVAPVGGEFSQEMVRITKDEDGTRREKRGRFRFVPLIEE